MSDFDVDQMIKDLAERFAAEGRSMAGLQLGDLRDALLHPKAPAEVARLMTLEATSIQQGDPAPDFCLPHLPGHGEGTIRLSERLAERPVALIFGSYT